MTPASQTRRSVDVKTACAKIFAKRGARPDAKADTLQRKRSVKHDARA